MPRQLGRHLPRPHPRHGERHRRRRPHRRAEHLHVRHRPQPAVSRANSSPSYCATAAIETRSRSRRAPSPSPQRSARWSTAAGDPRVQLERRASPTRSGRAPGPAPGTSLSGCSWAAAAGSADDRAHVRAAPLVGRQGEEVGAQLGWSRTGAAPRARRRRRPAPPRRAPGRRSPATSGQVPIALLAAVSATSRVRSGQQLVVLPGRQLAGLDVHLRPADLDAGLLGELQPRPDVRVVVEPAEHDLVAGAPGPGQRRANVQVRVVMFGPRTTPAGTPPTRSATAVRAPETSASVRPDAGKTPPRGATGMRIAAPTACATDSGTSEPAGPVERARNRPRERGTGHGPELRRAPPPCRFTLVVRGSE